MKTKILILFVLMITSARSQALFQFLEESSGARALGLAGAFVSMPDDASAVFYNPATLSTIENQNFSLTFMKHVVDINSGNTVYSRKFEDVGTFAGSVNFTNYGSFNYADKEGNTFGSFSANNLMFGVSYSNLLDTNFFYGATLKFVYVTLEKYSSTALAVDAGLFYRIPDKRVNLGLSILNAGMQLSDIGGYEDALPLDVRFGINHRLRGLPLLVNANLHHLNESEGGFFERFKNFSVGGELYLGENIRVRLGYDNRIRINATSLYDKGLSGMTAGVGIVVKDYRIDYGLARVGSAAWIHKLSFGFHL